MASLVEGTALIHPRHKRIRITDKVIQLERRTKVRYPMDAPLSFRTLDAAGLEGDGRVENMSSIGLFVISHHQLRVGAMLEIRMHWPTLLEQRVPLQFIAIGKVVRCDAYSFAILFRGHKFRTAALRTLPSLVLPRTADGAIGLVSPKATC